ncbi:hypothetical protein GCM10022223_02890 [Kineosporia mesophila]|uniref:Uncharacterized protein n=1 Tax=Kineosporia mesophila TaxID=566012 RepID=A0ABP6YUT6_9ACTN|nr:hypothetical protein [Kineosporia mesophila]MCD5351777.1 hypothetical protein [Kineosporia mesophila]
MRWDELFDDLEARFDEQERAEAEADLVDLVRGERDRVTFTDRLRAHLGGVIALDLRDGSNRRGTVLEVGRDWVLLSDRTGLLVPVDAVVSAGGLSRQSLPEEGKVGCRLRLGTVLRGLSRDRAGVGIDFWPTGRLDGTIDRVGSDHLDLAVHPSDVARRVGEVRQVRTVPFQAMAAIRTR